MEFEERLAAATADAIDPRRGKSIATCAAKRKSVPKTETRPRFLAILEGGNRGGVKEAPRHTIRRRLDEPKLELGAKVSLKDGAIGVVLARYIRSGRSDEVCYTVEVISDDGKREHHDRP